MTVPKYRGTERKCLDAFTEGQSIESSVPVPGTVKSLRQSIYTVPDDNVHINAYVKIGHFLCGAASIAVRLLFECEFFFQPKIGGCGLYCSAAYIRRNTVFKEIYPSMCISSTQRA